jgi:hypothetical protein
VLVSAIVVAVGAAVALLIVAALREAPPAQTPVAIVAIPAPRADGPECRQLTGALPDQMGDYRRAPVVAPAPPGAAAWQATPDGEAVILRCGVERPAEFVVGSPIQVVDDVQWFRVGDDAAGDGRSTWFAVDRPVYVALTLPAGSGPTPIQDVSRLIGKSLPVKAIDPAPAR